MMNDDRYTFQESARPQPQQSTFEIESKLLQTSSNHIDSRQSALHFNQHIHELVLLALALLL